MDCSLQLHTGIMQYTTAGSCMAAGYRNSCCLADHESCQGSSSICRCDANCRLFEDCCSDVVHDCEEQGSSIPVAAMLMIMKNIIFT